MSDNDETEKLKNNSESQHVENSPVPVDNSDNKQGSELSSAISENPSDVENSGKVQNGGARPGAGRPKGSMNAESVQKMAVKKDFEERIRKVVDPLFNAQLTLAVGVQYVFKKEKVEKITKKGVFKVWTRFERVIDPLEINEYLNGDYNSDDTKYYMLTVEKPDAKAIDSLLDRYFGRAPQSLNIKDDRPDPITAVLKRFGLLTEDEEEDSSDDRETESPESTAS